MTQPSPLKRREIIDALRMGAVPRRGLELFATGLDGFVRAIDEELDAVAAGQGKFKAVRGDYGTGKTFFARWLEHRARDRGFATTLVQISETETPIYRLETVYRRAIEGLETAEWSTGAFRSLVDRWFYDLEDEVLASGSVAADDTGAVALAVGALLESRLAEVSKVQPQFAAALRACHTARLSGDVAMAEGLVAWLMGQPSVAASIKRTAGIKGDLDNDAAAGFLRGLLELLRQTGRKGLVLVLDELETIQRVRTDSREKSLNALRTLIDAVADNQYPGLYVLITGTPQFFDGPHGVRRLEPLAMRLHTELDDSGFDNPRAVQLRLRPFTIERMVEVGRKVRDLYPSGAAARIAGRVTDAVLDGLAHGVAGQLGGRVGVAPRIYLKRLVDVLDRVDQHEGFDPAKHYELVLRANELTAEERAAAGMERSVDDIELELGDQAGGVE
jgi:hypothetical protein